MKGLFYSSKTHPFYPKWQGIYDNIVMMIVVMQIPKQPSNPTISKGWIVCYFNSFC